MFPPLSASLPALARRLPGALASVHRWLGIAGCLLFVMWFGSGLVMSVVGFPALSDAERLQGLGALDAAQIRVSPTAALQAAGVHSFPRRLWLEALPREDGSSEPVWRMTMADGGRHAISARSGARVTAIDVARAEAIARAFSGQPGARHVGIVERDQWTVLATLDRQRPFHRIALDDEAGTELYVSARSGEVVRDSTQRERFWNWLGAVPHWFYFTPLREQSVLWRQTLLWVSGICCISALSGLLLGVLRLRRRAPLSPFSGWMKLHHLAGLGGGLFVLAWMVSGWLSMSPGDWLRNTPPGNAAMARYTGSVAAAFPWPHDAQALVPLFAEADWKDVQLYWVRGQARMTLTAGNGFRRSVDMPDLGHPDVTEHHAEAVSRALIPDARLAAIERLIHEDAWWYARRDAKELPVWRVKLEDDAETWVHIDALDGRMLGTLDRDARLRRWLFNAPHSFELPALAGRPALRYALLWLAALAGLTLSVSAVVIAARRLTRPRVDR